MARRRATAVSAIVLALGLAGAGATPFIVQSASASVTAYDPPVEPCDVADPDCQSDPQTTVTVTTTLGTPTPEGDPETTVTTTVTASPKKTKTPTPTKSSTPPATPPQTTPTQNLEPVPSQNVEPPPTSTSSTPDATVEMPTVGPTTTAPVLPTETQSAASEEVPLELRGAAPEFDQRTLTQKLSIPALVLVLLALFAVLIFEGRLRRMAHAAAVRKAGPQMGGRPDMPPGGYPAGPGYAAAGFPPAGYPGGTAYAPIISFVPVQTYPSGQVYQDVGHPYPPQGYAQEPPPAAPSEPPPVVLHPDEFHSYNHEPPKPKEYRDPFEPLVPPADIPAGGGTPFEDGHEHPLGSASAAESGDSEPWQQGTSLFEPPQRPGQEYEPPPYLPADEDVTAVQPLPQQEPTKEMPDSERERFRRSE
ncbi:hypothetical protein OHA25_18645 [Nonomuraea sp. NBC_00507]|uniref:hypothetical protein n=1 Tax=Nonomuraea sp. NBC_00507 TaxID=2976002 RepID=UPI002E18FDB0